MRNQLSTTKGKGFQEISPISIPILGFQPTYKATIFTSSSYSLIINFFFGKQHLKLIFKLSKFFGKFLPDKYVQKNDRRRNNVKKKGCTFPWNLKNFKLIQTNMVLQCCTIQTTMLHIHNGILLDYKKRKSYNLLLNGQNWRVSCLVKLVRRRKKDTELFISYAEYKGS